MQSADQHVQCWKWVLDVRLGGFEDSFFSPPGTLKAMMHYNYWGTFVLSKNVSFSSVFMLIILASRFSRQALLIPFLHSLNHRGVAVPLLAHIWFDLLTFTRGTCDSATMNISDSGWLWRATIRSVGSPPHFHPSLLQSEPGTRPAVAMPVAHWQMALYPLCIHDLTFARLCIHLPSSHICRPTL